ncbi:hypothetical protein [Pseudoalteromonas carrageenovora]|uniref:hypothetical protein n=1 Tax=Pseudoalteromonas carrageenovora TaxID=227 RepID=UPI0026E2AFA1|nr:hypothetical protein [Pseudoalteromonas carrageenovora]MDO6548695.1 hypothetical protein [Pseudoalteromonas carrageenovora]MDO6832949.1 hypothetical protein [Pseudoalteromonas carrageenovora]
MNISANFIYIILIFSSLIPALLSLRLAAKQNRSKLVSALVTFVLGFTFIGGWIYLAVMNLVNPKNKDAVQ